mmetsp:Transcript_56124/g.121440  ORF Transcript_56124/g.121440 Transcript_56124/m.121440 type:complete len:363 (+) Transcript_56124:68-1156(+)
MVLCSAVLSAVTGGLLMKVLGSQDRQQSQGRTGGRRRRQAPPSPRSSLASPAASPRSKPLEIFELTDPEDDDDTHLPPSAVPPNNTMGRRASRESRRASLASLEGRTSNWMPPSPEMEPMINSWGWEGFSMEETRKHAEAAQTQMLLKSPEEVLQSLQRGNARFWMGKSERPDKSAFERRALIIKQFPTTAILGCADSRVPTEIIFDQGLGDIFVTRVAGNCLDQGTLASLQYAVRHVKVKVVLVLGHEGCGAVKAATQPLDQVLEEPDSLSRILKEIKGGFNMEQIGIMTDYRARDREIAITNVMCQLEKLRREENFSSKVRDGSILLAGAFYEISSGIVDFVHTVNAENVDRSCLPEHNS